MPRTDRKRAVAFAPAHVTGVVLPDTRARDPRGQGSRGLGFVLACGVYATAEWDPHGETSLVVRADRRGRLPISEEAARSLVDDRPGALRVRLLHDVPIGQGFGTSAAGALATSLAVARVLGIPRRRAVEAAHLADLVGGGGLGGVAAILAGGLEVRTRPGLPPLGRVAHRGASTPLLIGVTGPRVATSRLLGDRRVLARLHRAAAGLIPNRGPASALDLARRGAQFTDRLGLAPPALRAAISALRRRGLVAGQAMFGQSFFAVAPDAASWLRGRAWLTEAGLPFLVTSVEGSGARVLGPDERVLRGRPVSLPSGASLAPGQLFRGGGGLARAP